MEKNKKSPDIRVVEAYAQKCYDNANCEYGGGNYYIHINLVGDVLKKYKHVFKSTDDLYITSCAVPTHDLIEEAKQSFNNIKDVCGKDVAKITLLVTDVPAENRLMKHLLTMGKTVGDHRAIILKMCDIYANASFSKKCGSSMYSKYVREYQYRRPIFQMALEWYKDKLDQDVLQNFWNELDEIHNFK